MHCNCVSDIQFVSVSAALRQEDKLKVDCFRTEVIFQNHRVREKQKVAWAFSDVFSSSVRFICGVINMYTA